MLAGREWAQYSIKRAPLRVTVPRAGQRSTYFLQLPYLWSVPLLVSSALLHWFISQAIFIIRLELYRNGVAVPISSIADRSDSRYDTLANFHRSGGFFTAVGYSDVALLVAILWGSALVAVCLLVAGCCKYPTEMLSGGTNSAVISAACHLRYGGDEIGGDRVEDDVTLKPLMWGVTEEGTHDRPGHCSFTAHDVQKLRVGCLYAGERRRMNVTS